MSYKLLKDFIKNNIEKGTVFDGINVEQIKRIENELETSLPEEYKEFLLDFGYISIYGVEIYGYIRKTNYNILTEETKKYLKDIKNMILLSNEGEYLVCLNVENGLIFISNIAGEDMISTGQTFSEYYLERFVLAKKDYELFG